METQEFTRLVNFTYDRGHAERIVKRLTNAVIVEETLGRGEFTWKKFNIFAKSDVPNIPGEETGLQVTKPFENVHAAVKGTKYVQIMGIVVSSTIFRKLFRLGRSEPLGYDHMESNRKLKLARPRHGFTEPGFAGSVVMTAVEGNRLRLDFNDPINATIYLNHQEDIGDEEPKELITPEECVFVEKGS